MTLLPTTNLHVGTRRQSVPVFFGVTIAITQWLRPRLSLVVLVLSCCTFGILVYGAVRIGDICPRDGRQPCLWYGLADTVEPFHRQPATTPMADADRQDAKTCTGFPDSSSVLLAMKTGASESWSKIPTQLNTNLRCIEDFLIFSDMAQTINGVTIHDSLDTVLPEVSKNSQDFELYRRQKLCPIDQESCNRDFQAAEQGWALDKYKNIHIAEKAYALRPGFDWYMFVDADSYVVWPTLMEWLRRVDAQGKMYMGSVAMLGDMPFAHGGSGYLVSRGLMEDMFDGKTGVANRYDTAASQTCCGDALFSQAVQNETGVEVVNVWPTVNGEKAGSLDYGPKQWCQPLATMHHVSSQEVSEVDAFERMRNYSSPMRIKDVFEAFIHAQLVTVRPDWDNQSDEIHFVDPSLPRESFLWVDSHKVRAPDGLPDYQQKAHLDPESCQLACKSLKDCLQWRFYRSVCSLSSTVRMGRPRSLSVEDRLTSGWEVNRIDAWAKVNDECGNITWPEMGLGES